MRLLNLNSKLQTLNLTWGPHPVIGIVKDDSRHDGDYVGSSYIPMKTITG